MRISDWSSDVCSSDLILDPTDWAADALCRPRDQDVFGVDLAPGAEHPTDVDVMTDHLRINAVAGLGPHLSGEAQVLRLSPPLPSRPVELSHHAPFLQRHRRVPLAHAPG